MTQIIKDLSDLQKIVDSLRPEYNQKFFEVINVVVKRILDEQEKSQPKNQSTDNNVIDSQEPKFSFKQLITTETKQNKSEPSPNLDVLKASLNRNTNLPPPPPLPTTGQIPTASTFASRGVGAGILNFKGGLSSKPQVNKKTLLSVTDCLGFLYPNLQDAANEALKSPSTPRDVYQFLKQVDGNVTLKQLQMMLYPNLTWGKYIEKVYLLYKERYFSIRRTKDYPYESEFFIRLGEILVSLGLLDESTIEKALEYQKDGFIPSSTQPQNWMDKTKNLVLQIDAVPNRKKLLGDLLIEMDIISKDQLNYVLGLQRWFKGITDKT